MNQSIAVLFKSRLFLGDSKKHGSDETTVIEEKRDKTTVDKTPSSGVIRAQSNPDGLNCIKEEGSTVSDDDGEELQVPKQNKGHKLRSLKNRMTSLPDLRFKSNSSLDSCSDSRSSDTAIESSTGHSRDSSNHHNFNKLKEKTRSWFSSNNVDETYNHSAIKSIPKINIANENYVSFDDGSLKKQQKRSSEKRVSMGSISRINTTSSGGSFTRSKSCYTRWSLVRSNSEIDQIKRLSTFSQSSRHSTENSSESNSILTVNPVVRRRSKTLGALESDTKGGSSPGVRTSRVRSNSSLNNQYFASPITSAFPPSNSATQLAVPFPTQLPSSPRFSNSSSRRSNSIVNAISNFVSVKTSSFSSKQNSPKYLFALEFLPSPPEPSSDDTCELYLLKIADYGKFISVILSQDDDAFKNKCLYNFIAKNFEFGQESLDISLRKLLMFIELPKETQQIDRVLAEFSKAYYQENKTNSMWENSDQVYFMTYSLLMLHTDAFNSNNKCKMLKQDFVRLLRADPESGGHSVPKEFLEYFFDNITAREFSQVDLPLNFYGGEEAAVEEGEIQPPPEVPYSPKEIIESGKLFSRPDISPLMLGGRSSSNPIAPHISLSVTPNTSSPSSLSNLSIRNDDIDIYFHIANNSLSSVMLQLDIDYTWDTSNETKSSDSHAKTYSKYMSVIKETKGGYLRFQKVHATSLLEKNFDLLSLNEVDPEYVHLKIIQMGELEELVTNKKFSIVGSVNRLTWKRCFGVLTSCCLLIFDDMNWVDPKVLTDVNTQTSNYILDCEPSFEIHMKLDCNGLFATESPKMGQLVCPSNIHQDIEPNTDEPVVHVYSKNQKYTFKCTSDYEKYNWINAINVVAAFDGCYIDMGTIPNTISATRKSSVDEKLNKLGKNKSMKQEKLDYFNNFMNATRHTIPITSKIRSNMIDYAIQLSKKMEWLLYEICRNEVYVGIMQQLVGLSNSRGSSPRSSIEQSFIFNETLERCDTDCTASHDHDASFDMNEILNTF